MSGRNFYTVDVFAENKFAGNQLAVFMDGSNLTGDMMQSIAREMNYSETTFIMSDEVHNGGYDVRIFTPGAELPFAGHPSLGTAFIIQQKIIGKKVDVVRLNMKAGQIPVTFGYVGNKPDILWMKQNRPEFGEILDRKEMAPLLGLEVEDIDDDFPIEEVSTGFYTSIVPLKSMAAVKKARAVVGDFLQYVHDKKGKTVLIFSRETIYDENDLHVRFFADYLGVAEDPATGSANGCLAAYLVKNEYFGNEEIDVRVEQGYEIKRPSLLLLRAGVTDGGIDVHVGGRVQMMAKGELYL